MIIFSGGLTTDKPAVTVMKGKSVALLELDFQIISIIPLIKSPWNCDVPTPGEMFVLLGLYIHCLHGPNHISHMLYIINSFSTISRLNSVNFKIFD